MKICEHCGCIITPGQYHDRKQLTDVEWKCFPVWGSPPASAAETERQLQQQRSDRGDPSTAL